MKNNTFGLTKVILDNLAKGNNVFYEKQFYIDVGIPTKCEKIRKKI